jgi:hypothetical protein
MVFPSLIAETPNAGKWGYRFLVSDGALIGDASVSAFVSKGRAESQVVGGNYIAVRHKVTQRTTGRPDAGETLVLVGVDTASLTDEEQGHVITTLRSRLPEIDAAAQEIDWSTEKRLVVPQRRLAEWVSEAIRSLPVADIAGGPQELGRTPPSTEPELPRKHAWRYAARLVTVSVFILLSVTAVGLITGRLPFLFGWAFLDTSQSGGLQSEKDRSPHGGASEGGGTNSSSRDVFAAKLEEIKSATRGARDQATLDGLRTRLYELERARALTKGEHREVDDLRQELTSKQQKIKGEQARIRQENNRFYLGIEESLREAMDLGTLNSLLTRLDQVPHPDSVTEDEQRLQARLRDRIRSEQTELRWKEFVQRYRELESMGDFKKAANHLRAWNGGKEREFVELRDAYKAALKGSLGKAMDRGITGAAFSAIRQMIRERFSSPEVDDVVGKSFFQPAWDRLDVAEDKYLYERIRVSPSVDVEEDRVRAYLNSPVARKRMSKAVEDLKQYLDTANDERTLTFSITSIYWGKCWTGENTIELTVKPDGKERVSIDSVQVTAEREKELKLSKSPVEISFKAKPNARIALKVKVYKSETHDNGTFAQTVTMAGLQRLSGEGLKLDAVPSATGRAEGNKIKFEIRGIPVKPNLPDWNDD